MTGVYTSVRSGLRNVALAALSEYTSPQVIFSNSSGTEPSGSYAVVNILNIVQIGHRSTSTLLDLNKNQATFVSYEVQAQYSFIGSESGDMAQSFTQRINNIQSSLNAQTTNKLGVMRKSSIRRSPQLRDTKWVEYHNIDVTFSYTVVTQEVTDEIDVVIIQNQVTNNTFTVPPGQVIP
jgi:hypothetical protein